MTTKMEEVKYSLSWNQHRNTICQGLSALQQNGEFVDMTLAADGHHVQVHKMVMSLASPYIKELIATAQCPHPVIFLNNVSYTTLCSILEYVYTGEVIVAKEDLSKLLEASKSLSIRGLQKMTKSPDVNNLLQSQESNDEDQSTENDVKQDHQLAVNLSESEDVAYDDVENDQEDTSYIQDEPQTTPSNKFENMKKIISSKGANGTFSTPLEKQTILDSHCLQYTLSNHGNLQIVLNRHIYGLKYTSKTLRRLWRCVNHPKKQCPAFVVTRNNQILERKYSHNHPFLDLRILKKFSEGTIFEAIDDAENMLITVKKQKGLMKRKPTVKAKEIKMYSL